MKPTVYLAGPIKGLSYDGATTWREDAQIALAAVGIVALSPMRFKRYLAGELTIGDSYADFTLSTEQGITTRDRFDVQRCDVVLMNLLGAEKVSIGTMIEAGWADAYRKPVVLVVEDSGNAHDHCMLRTIAGFRVPTLAAGLDTVAALLIPGAKA